MQPAQPASATPKVSGFRIGLLYGIILAAVLIAISVIGVFTRDLGGGVGLALNAVSIIVALVAYFFAGYRASARSGKVSTGLVAGLWTGLISALLSSIVSIVMLLPTLPTLTETENRALSDAGSNVRVDDTTMLVFLIIAFVIGVVIIALIALGIGAIGGAVGKGRAPMPQLAYQESMYQSPMVGGYPPQSGNYPPQSGGYPPQSGGYPPQQ